MTPTHPLPAAGVAHLLARFTADLVRAGLAETEVAVAVRCLARLLTRVRVGSRTRPSANGHPAPKEGD
jgi:hypothetical protein